LFQKARSRECLHSSHSKTATFGQKHYVWRGLFCSAFVQKTKTLIVFRNPSNGHFQEAKSRYPLQSFVLNPSTKGFSLHPSDSELAKQSGLGSYNFPFCYDFWSL
jgi:hypothetical protein